MARGDHPASPQIFRERVRQDRLHVTAGGLEYAWRLTFSPVAPRSDFWSKASLERISRERRSIVLGWRDTRSKALANRHAWRRGVAPIHEQSSCAALRYTEDALERKLYVIRKARGSLKVGGLGHDGPGDFYLPSFSARDQSTKACALAADSRNFLKERPTREVIQRVAWLHQRLSDNTFRPGTAPPVPLRRRNGEYQHAHGQCQLDQRGDNYGRSAVRATT